MEERIAGCSMERSGSVEGMGCGSAVSYSGATAMRSAADFRGLPLGMAYMVKMVRWKESLNHWSEFKSKIRWLDPISTAGFKGLQYPLQRNILSK